MGSLCSKEIHETSSDSSGAGNNFNASKFTSELKAYSLPCREDASLQYFDAHLQARANIVINVLANGIQSNHSSLSLSSVTYVTSFILEINEQVINVVLDCQNDFRNGKHAFDLVEQYLQNTFEILQFCSELRRILSRAHNSLYFLLVDLQTLEERGTVSYFKLLGELEKFKAFSDGFTEDFSGTFHRLNTQQLEMFEKFSLKLKKLATKVKYVEIFQKFSSIFSEVTAATVIAPSVVPRGESVSTEELRIQLTAFQSNVKNLEEEANRCYEHISSATKVALNKFAERN